MGEQVSVSVKQMRRWMSGELSTRPRPAACRVAERLFGHSIETLLGPPARSLLGSSAAPGTAWSGGATAHPTGPAAVDQARWVRTAAGESALFARWAEVSNVGPLTIEQLHADLRYQAQAYLQHPPLPVFLGIKHVRDRAFELLEGRQPPSQTRELYAIAGYACALLSWIAGDLGQPAAADTLGRTGWLCAELADSDELRAWVLATRSKGAFWAGQYPAAVAFAQQGQTYGSPTTVTVLLAAQEADAWAELGAAPEARTAIRAANESSTQVHDADCIGGLLSCGAAREANYAAGVYVRLGDIDAALTATDRAFAAYATHEHRSYGTEAQIHLTRTAAYLLKDELDGALTAAAPVFALPVEQRLEPVSRRVRQVGRSLTRSRLSGSAAARQLRDQIEDFCAQTAVKALPS